MTYHEFKLEYAPKTKKEWALYTIRLPFAVLGAVIAFIIGWGIYFFCLGIGPICLITLIVWDLPIWIGLFKGNTENQDARIGFQVMPFMLCARTFLVMLKGDLEDL